MEFLEWVKGIASQETLQHIGHIGIWAIIFAESGILAGFFLPGDSLLFTAGLLAWTGHLNIYYLIIGGIIAAITGDSFGYYLGRKFGPRVFSKENSRIFHKDHIERAKQYFAKYGPITIFLARFTPFIRTFAPVLAGVGGMNYKTFVFYNIFGGIFWVTSMSLLGYFLGSIIPDIDRYVLPIIGVVILLSLIPAVIGLVRSKRIPS
ncbi:MAG: VTT domain-containing protein [Patescibacteria group bacterium]